MTTRYCLCGATLQARSTPPDFAERIAVHFDVQHHGEGHGPATPAQAARVRRREERLAELNRRADEHTEECR